MDNNHVNLKEQKIRRVCHQETLHEKHFLQEGFLVFKPSMVSFEIARRIRTVTEQTERYANYGALNGQKSQEMVRGN